MPPSSEVHVGGEDPIASKICSDIRGTKYDFAPPEQTTGKLVRLLGGSANFTYRAWNICGQSSAIIKHAEPYIAVNENWPLDPIRLYYESAMLTALSAKPLVSYNNVQVVAPKLYHYDSTKGNLFMEDMVDTVDLKGYITENKTSLVQAAVERLGTALGKWLASFHVWGAAEEQNSLRVAVATNPITQLKYAINYGRLEATIELAPEILASSRQLFRDMAIAYKEEFDLGKGTLIHGDFWTGNILLDNGPLPEHGLIVAKIIDFEFSQIGSVAFDIGQCLAEMWLLTHFRSIPAGEQLIKSTIAGYGDLDEDTAFRTAIHFGCHLVVWPVRVPGWSENQSHMEACIRFGLECMSYAWGPQKEKKWFKGGVLDGLFKYEDTDA